MKRIRIGNYVAGIRFNRTGHAIFGNFMIGKVADTLGILNSIKGSYDQMLFADFDVSNVNDIIQEIMDKEINGILFKSEMKNQDTHYFLISPFHYSQLEIRQILAEMNCVDGKFVGVYMRDNVNAIRFVPKIIGKYQSRFISPFLVFENAPNKLGVKAMLEAINEFYPETARMFTKEIECDDTHFDFDNPERSDLTLREYETIRW